MRLAVIASIGSYAADDVAAKVRHFQSVLHPETEVTMLVAASGVPYVESSLELHYTAVAVAEAVVQAAAEGYDAIVGTAFLDNGLDAARELVEIPVVGPAKTCLYLAATLAHRFAVISAAGDLPRHVRSLAKELGVDDRLVATPALDCTVAEFLRDEERTLGLAIAAGRELVEERGAQAIVLGCGATTGLAARMGAALGVPVLDPGLVAAKHAEMLVALGLSHSKRAFPYNERVMRLLQERARR